MCGEMNLIRIMHLFIFIFQLDVTNFTVIRTRAKSNGNNVIKKVCY